MPKTLADRPKLEGVLVVQYSLYAEVAEGRRYAGGRPLRLGPADILAYVQLHNVARTEIATLIETVQLFDTAWLQAQVTLQEDKKTKSSVPTA